ncbi:MAG TPA: RHS repeat-associated core domain-containing protein [Gemmatimonadaceae bacterium]|nr:RHS repeat-associated core domain-containing protein [Gemmatimonadaceae bacterium]
MPDPHGQDGEHCTPSGGWTFVSQSSYTYDSANNRTDLGAVLTPGNRATTFNGYTLTYDNVGNLTHKSKTGFDQFFYWNSIGQLDSVVTNGVKVSFDYDGLGRRVSKRTGLDLRYIYSGGQLIAEVDSSITTTAQKIYRYYPGVDNPHSVKEVSGTYYYLSAIGTPGVAAVIDSTGKIKDRYRYNPWGGLEDSVETATNVLKFAAREYDPETHLYYNRARYYDPQLARFISEDPIGQSGGVNQYAYAGNNPVGAADPSGECFGSFSSGSDQDYLYGGDWGDCSPQKDGLGMTFGAGLWGGESWHCTSTDVNYCLASAKLYLRFGISLSSDYWVGGEFKDVSLGCRPLNGWEWLAEHCAFRWRFTAGGPIYGELEDEGGVSQIFRGPTVQKSTPSAFDWEILGGADLAAKIWQFFGNVADSWPKDPYVLGDSNEFACAVLRRAGVRLTTSQWFHFNNFRTTFGPMGLDGCAPLFSP